MLSLRPLALVPWKSRFWRPASQVAWYEGVQRCRTPPTSPDRIGWCGRLQVEDLHVLATLARLVAVSNGSTQVTREAVLRAVNLQAARMARNPPRSRAAINAEREAAARQRQVAKAAKLVAANKKA